MPERSIEALVVTVLPWAAGIDLNGLDAGLLEPGLEVAGDELRSVVGAQILRFSVFEEQGIESIQNLGMAHLGSDGDAKRLAGVFIEDGEHLVTAAAAQLVVDEVNAPDMVRILRSQPNDGAVLVVKPPAPLVAMWQLQALFPPQALDLLVIDRPALDTKKLGDVAVTVAAILLGQPDQGQAQFVIILWSRLVAQGAPCQDDRFAGSSLRGVELLANMDHSLT